MINLEFAGLELYMQARTTLLLSAAMAAELNGVAGIRPRLADRCRPL